jgi:hypothetical protein
MSSECRGDRLRTFFATRLAWRAFAVAVLVALFASPGCQSTPRGELVPFTDEMRQRYQLDSSEIRKLQFYLSDRIILERVAEKGEGRVDAGRLIVRSGTVIHQIVVERGTPGAAEARAEIGDSRDGHAIEISFEIGAPLRFSAAKAGGTYTLVDPIQRGSFADLLASFGTKRRLVVDFAESPWPVIEGGSAILMIERSALGKLRRTQRVLPGVKVKAR